MESSQLAERSCREGTRKLVEVSWELDCMGLVEHVALAQLRSGKPYH